VLDIDKIRELIEMMVANDLVEISLREGDKEVSLRRPTEKPAHAGMTMQTVMVPPAAPMPTPPGGAFGSPVSSPAAPVVERRDEPALIEIGSPMVGTFYLSADPNSPPFVQEGSVVRPGTVVCLLEAMKVFSEIKAEVSGTIQRVLVKNMEPVEYGQPLFLVRPA